MLVCCGSTCQQRNLHASLGGAEADLVLMETVISPFGIGFLAGKLFLLLPLRFESALLVLLVLVFCCSFRLLTLTHPSFPVILFPTFEISAADLSGRCGTVLTSGSTFHVTLTIF